MSKSRTPKTYGFPVVGKVLTLLTTEKGKVGSIQPCQERKEETHELESTFGNDIKESLELVERDDQIERRNKLGGGSKHFDLDGIFVVEKEPGVHFRISFTFLVSFSSNAVKSQKDIEVREEIVWVRIKKRFCKFASIDFHGGKRKSNRNHAKNKDALGVGSIWGAVGKEGKITGDRGQVIIMMLRNRRSIDCLSTILPAYLGSQLVKMSVQVLGRGMVLFGQSCRFTNAVPKSR